MDKNYMYVYDNSVKHVIFVYTIFSFCFIFLRISHSFFIQTWKNIHI